MTVLTAEVLTERMQTAQVVAVLWRTKARDEHPCLLFRVEPVAAVSRVRSVRLHGNDKLLRLAGFPRINKMRMPSRALVAENTRLNAVTLCKELRLIICGD